MCIESTHITYITYINSRLFLSKNRFEKIAVLHNPRRKFIEERISENIEDRRHNIYI